MSSGKYTHFLFQDCYCQARPPAEVAMTTGLAFLSFKEYDIKEKKKKQFLIDYRSTVILKRIILKTY